MTAPARLELPDALRALALGAVLLVNTMGYPDMPWGPLLGEVRPAGDLLAMGLQAVAGALVQGKAYPALAFLFGMSLAWSMAGRSPDPRRHAGRRLRALLALGLLHGLFLYAGDVLTAYALCGLLVLPHVRAPGHRLRRRLKRALWLAAAAFCLFVGASALTSLEGAGLPGAGSEETLGAAATVAEFVAVNASAYLAAHTLGLLYVLPVMHLFMLAGVVAARLRLLSHRRWAAWREEVVRRWLGRLLVANVLYGLGLVALAHAGRPWQSLLEFAGPLVCAPLSAVWVLHLANAWARGRRGWAHLIAPLGRCTLSVYLSHSVVCMVLLGGVGLGLEAGTAARVLLAVAVWCGALALARRHTGRWPLEAWLGRRT